MKCRKHVADLSSAAGVCASCLRERLFLLISSQFQQQHLDEDYLHRHSDPNPPPPLIFPNSVSPYVARRKFHSSTDCDVSLVFPSATAAPDHHRRLFHTTPQVEISRTRRKSRFSILSSFANLFKSSRSESDPKTATETKSSPMWYPAGSKSKTVPKFVGERIKSRVSHRGMSPERFSEEELEMEEEEEEEESSPWKQTPVITTARRRNSNLSGLAFCLSPLVRASPNRNWSKGGGCPAHEGDGSRKMAAATRTAFCKNRSRKMADFGRGYNR